MDTRTNPSKETIIGMLRAWISQRPGLEACNYFSGGFHNHAAELSNYRSEVRRIGRQLADARTLLRQVELSGITAEDLMEAFPRAFSGRLTLEAHPKKPGSWRIDYCTGQYWPTEYRAAACAVLASALWNYKRDDMPEPGYFVECLYEDNHGIGTECIRANVGTYATRADAESYAGTIKPERRAHVSTEYNGKSAGDWLRSSFRREFGRGIANRWFN